jgi:hypothetical protein
MIFNAYIKLKNHGSSAYRQRLNGNVTGALLGRTRRLVSAAQSTVELKNVDIAIPLMKLKLY